MKNIFTIVFTILLALHANAQDIITTTKGEEMYVKVLEVTSTLINTNYPILQIQIFIP